MGLEPFFERTTCAGTQMVGKGPQVCHCSQQIPTAEIAAAVEEGVSRLNVDRKRSVRAEVSGILRRAKPPPKNINKDVMFQSALSS